MGNIHPIRNQTQNLRPILLANNPEIVGIPNKAIIPKVVSNKNPISIFL